MRVEIRRWRMAGGPDPDGNVPVAYDVLVPLEDVPPGNSSNIETISEGKHYKQFPDATWSTDLPPGPERYVAWLDHEKAAEQRMLAFLHEHCPETRGLTKWPLLWTYIAPEDAQDLHTVHFTVDDSEETAPRATSATAA